MPFERYSLWQVKRLIQPIIRSFPYRACILTDNAIGDDRLRRCELLVALHMMRETLRLPKYYEYQTIPVSRSLVHNVIGGISLTTSL